MIQAQDGGIGRWLFTKEALEHAQEAAHERAAQVLRERRMLVPKPLSLSQGSQLVIFYAQKLLELCKLCSAPSEVNWTSLVFFKRFYAVSSPMEFDPLTMMYTCVHVACKIEELREITLDKVLEVSGFAEDAAMKTKVTDLELQLLENLGFKLLVEPKPSGALRFLAEELRASTTSTVKGFPGSSENLQELLSKAETMVYDLCISSNAVLLYPASIIFAAAWGTALDEGLGHNNKGAVPSSSVITMLLQTLKEADKDSVSKMWKEVLHAMKHIHCKADLDKVAMQELAKTATKCQRAFGIIHEERKERHEAHRKERKRRRQDMKVPLSGSIEELKRKAQALQAHDEDVEDFVIHGPRDDMEED